MQLSEFKAKHVPGLYIFAHFDHESGAFIQAHVDGGYWIFRNEDGKTQEFWHFEDLKNAVEK